MALRIGLQLLDECFWTRAEASNLVAPTTWRTIGVLSALLEKVGFASEHWEACAPETGASIVDTEPIHGLIQGGP